MAGLERYPGCQQSRDPLLEGQVSLRPGLRHRDRAELITDVLAYERAEGLDRPRRAGLSPERERALLADFAAASPLP